jgi:hypothetical protein
MTIINSSLSQSQRHDVFAHRRLWSAVLLVGLQDAAKDFYKSQAEGHPSFAYEALRWLESDKDQPGCFSWICDLLEMSPYQVRMRWRMNLRKLAKEAA